VKTDRAVAAVSGFDTDFYLIDKHPGSPPDSGLKT